MVEIVKLRKFSEGCTLEEENALLKENNCRRLSVEEFVEVCNDEKIFDFIPCRLGEKGSFSAHRDYFDYYDRCYIYPYSIPSLRFGVLGVKIENKSKKSKRCFVYGKCSV